MASIEKMRELLTAACEVHGKPYSEALLTGWVACTKSVSDRQLMDCWWNICTHKVPKPSDLLQAVAGISPSDDWDVIMMVATGRAEIGQISGFAANALRKVGGIIAIANADDLKTAKLKAQWLENMATAGSGLPMADEEISLNPQPSPSNVIDLYRPDYTGEMRANALIKLLRSGQIKPALAKRLASDGDASIGHGGIPTAQRDRVLSAIAELQTELMEG
jgi:hypothetical protein